MAEQISGNANENDDLRRQIEESLSGGTGPKIARFALACLSGLIPLADRTRLKYLEGVSIQLYHRLKEEGMWAALASLADNLLAHETLEGEQVEEIVREWLG